MTFQLKRVYDPPAADDGTRILVERLWPRGLSKDKARIDFWAKETAPSHDLRRWFQHDPDKWPEFKQRYFAELDQVTSAIDDLRERARATTVTFVFASKETDYNNAVALREYLTSTT